MRYLITKVPQFQEILRYGEYVAQQTAVERAFKPTP